MNINSGIYKITNFKNNKMYIGSSVDLKRRRKTHFSNLRRNKHINTYLQNSFNKYGESNFTFEILEYVEDKLLLIEKEQYWLDKLNSYKNKYGYNICKKADSVLGRKHTEEAKKRIRQSNRGKHNFKHTEENKEKIRKFNLENNIIPPSFKGKHWSEEAIRKVARPVINLDTNEEFISINEAARVYGTDVSSIIKVCKGSRKIAGGFRWTYK